MWLDGGLSCNTPVPPGHVTWTVSPRWFGGTISPGVAAGTRSVRRDYGLFSLFPTCMDDCEFVQQVGGSMSMLIAARVVAVSYMHRGSMTMSRDRLTQDGFVDAVDYLSSPWLWPAPDAQGIT